MTTKTKTLQLEVNPDHVDPKPLGDRILITPPVGEDDYWMFRVKVGYGQSVVGFSKFGLIGIGFKVEKADWNTNLPSNCTPVKIFNHIKCNKGDKRIKDSDCIEAIKMIREIAFRHIKAESN